MNVIDIIGQIGHRSDGDCYLGVVGPVRVGKSTFIKRFMELCVLPNIEDEELKKRALDELPASGQGKTITTGEMKFVPSKAIPLKIDESYSVNVRLIDCVGYIVDDAKGYMEDGKMRLIKTPWFADPIPFDEAAKIGTEKVIKEHSTIGIMVTCDGSFGEIKRESFISSEEKMVEELKKTNKPFVIILNSATVGSPESIELRDSLEAKYNAPVVLLDVLNLQEEQSKEVLQKGIEEFPITSIALALPTWVNNLSSDHYIKQSLDKTIEDKMNEAYKIKDVNNLLPSLNENEFVSNVSLTDVDLSTGVVTITIDIDRKSVV